MDLIRQIVFILLAAISLAVFAAEPVDINTADKQTLMTVKGVGERRAEAIIAYREQFGPFRSVEDLMEVDGIGPATLDANREILVVPQPE